MVRTFIQKIIDKSRKHSPAFMVLLGRICPWICYYRQKDLASVVFSTNGVLFKWGIRHNSKPQGGLTMSSPGLPPGEERSVDCRQP